MEEKDLRSRFDERTKKNRIFAMVILGVITLLIIITLIAIITEPPTKEVRVISVNRVPEEKQESDRTTADEIDITVWSIFNDESETEPFAEHHVTIEEWKEVPEWDIPQEYKEAGGCLPESVRAYLYNLCQRSNISYPFMLALIETESGYQWDAESADGSCKGYTMINDKWHQERMQKLGVTDIYDPYGNLEVSIDFLSELFCKYHEASTVLMCYNCGESGAGRLLEKGIYCTAYSEKILAREAEISHEIYGY